jgi:hypothetical protein
MDLGNIINQFTGGNAPQGAPAELGQWLQNYQSGNANQVPHDEVHQAYQQFTQNADPQQVQQATQYGYQQVPQQQLPNIASTLLNVFQQHGLNPQAAGVQTTNPQQMNPHDLARMTQYAHEQRPDALHQLFQPGGLLSNPMVGMALASAVAYGVSRFGGQGH